MPHCGRNSQLNKVPMHSSSAVVRQIPYFLRKPFDTSGRSKQASYAALKDLAGV